MKISTRVLLAFLGISTAVLVVAIMTMVIRHDNRSDAWCRAHGYETLWGRDVVCIDPRTRQMYAPPGAR